MNYHSYSELFLQYFLLILFNSSDSRTVIKKMSKKCNNPGEFPVFLAVFFRKRDKQSQNVNVLEALLYNKLLVIIYHYYRYI